MSFIIIYVTHENIEEARRISNQVVAEKLAACANIFPVETTYWWNSEMASGNEMVSILKTTPELWESIKNRIESLHPYDVPCIMKFEVEANEAYEKWIQQSVLDH